jgi:hypothetical protein
MTSLTTMLSGHVDDNKNDTDKSAALDHRDADLYDRYLSILNTLPEGWSRNPQAGSVNGEAPFVHVSTGQVSWKHPNHDQLKSFLQQQEEQQKHQAMARNDDTSWNAPTDADAVQYQVRPTSTAGVAASSSSSSSSLLLLSSSFQQDQKMIKKLRLMLQAGAPLEVVERRAAVAKIDMSVVLWQDQQKQQKQQNEEDRLATNPAGTNMNTNKRIIVSPILVKKYSELLTQNKEIRKGKDHKNIQYVFLFSL